MHDYHMLRYKTSIICLTYNTNGVGCKRRATYVNVYIITINVLLLNLMLSLTCQLIFFKCHKCRKCIFHFLLFISLCCCCWFPPPAFLQYTLKKKIKKYLELLSENVAIQVKCSTNGVNISFSKKIVSSMKHIFLALQHLLLFFFSI